MKIIEINNCLECPFLGNERHYFCNKKFKDNYIAYQAGEYAEYQNELDMLFKLCPLDDTDDELKEAKENIEQLKIQCNTYAKRLVLLGEDDVIWYTKEKTYD